MYNILIYSCIYIHIYLQICIYIYIFIHTFDTVVTTIFPFFVFVNVNILRFIIREVGSTHKGADSAAICVSKPELS
jgi:hypothetical protein